jgi:hypothetical protein
MKIIRILLSQDRAGLFLRHLFAQLLHLARMALQNQLAISNRTHMSMHECLAALAKVSTQRALIRVATVVANLLANQVLEMASQAQST